LLPALVAGGFLLFRRRWDAIAKFCFHPGVLLTVVLGTGWYVIALFRGGEGFLDRQLLQENLERFFGGSGHSHSVYYYLPYLFSQGLPWSLFLPIVAWEAIKRDFWSDDHAVFLTFWFLGMFLFFSISAGKRPVYLLPVYPALSMLVARSIVNEVAHARSWLFYLRLLGILAAVMGAVLVVVALGAVWNHDPEWFFTPLEALLKAKDRANAMAVEHALATFGWSFTFVALASAVLWVLLAGFLWGGKLKVAAGQLVLISILLAYVIRGAVVPAIAQAKSYRPFMIEVNHRVGAREPLYIYGDSFNSDPVVFYRGAPIAALKTLPRESDRDERKDHVYIIMSEKDWTEAREKDSKLPDPLLVSSGTGPEGDARLVLVESSLPTAVQSSKFKVPPPNFVPPSAT
jgi:4-amino-4-deoxy-L-arabinose transferase-like glycosyltransferase